MKNEKKIGKMEQFWEKNLEIIENFSKKWKLSWTKSINQLK